MYKQLPSPLQSLLAHAGTFLQKNFPDSLFEDFSQLTVKLSPEVLLSALVPTLILLFSMASWRSYLGGRYSPFGAPATRSPPIVSEDDYHYLGPDDIVDPPRAQRNFVSNDAYGFPATSPRHPSTNSLEPDILNLRHRGRTYPLHFPAFAIGEGYLTVGELRRLVAKETNTADPRRVKLLYKGKQLKDDSIPCREEGLKQNSELMCVISETAPLSRNDEESDSADEDDMATAGVQVDVDGSLINSGRRKTKRKGHRGGASKKKDRDSPPISSAHPARDSNSYLNAENYASSGPLPQRPSSPLPSRKEAGTASTPLDKIEEIASNFYTNFLPQCTAFTSSPPLDTKTLDFEYKKLSESVLAQVLLKLDEIDTEGNEGARQRRRALVKETQAVLGKLDGVVGKGSQVWG